MYEVMEGEEGYFKMRGDGVMGAGRGTREREERERHVGDMPNLSSTVSRYNGSRVSSGTRENAQGLKLVTDWR